MIIVVADDFSGAAEVAGVALQRGLSAEVHVGELRPSTADVVVVDVNTRSCSVHEATSIHRRIATMIAQAEPRLFYKKVDSVLRGPIAFELDAMREAMKFDRTLLINSNPRKGRVVRNGCMWVNGELISETSFASDSEHPRTSPFVSQLLEPSPGRIAIVNCESEWFSDCLLVGEVVNASELESFASRVDGSSTLLAGGAEFFDAILSRALPQLNEIHRCVPLELAHDTLLVSGTALPSQLKSSDNVVLVHPGDKPLEVSSAICNCLVERGFAVLSSAASPVINKLPEAATPSTASDRDASKECNEQMVATVGVILAHCKPQQLWIEGGRTASEIVRWMGWDRMHVHEVYADGVVGLQPHEPNAPKLVVKPGSYPWPLSLHDPLTIKGVAS